MSATVPVVAFLVINLSSAGNDFRVRFKPLTSRRPMPELYSDLLSKRRRQQAVCQGCMNKQMPRCQAQNEVFLDYVESFIEHSV